MRRGDTARIRRGPRAILWVLLACLPAGLVPAGAATGGAAAVIVFGSTYYPGDTKLAVQTLYIAAGSSLTLVNAETGPIGHTITSTACLVNGLIDNSEDCINDPGAQRLFDSGDTNQLKSNRVAGVETLSTGTFTFFCNVHLLMRGVLNVI